MPQTYDLILKGGVVVNQDGRGERDVGINGSTIAAIGDLGQASAGRTLDCRGLHVLPGVIDTQVHFREPGLEHKEDLETGSRAAVLGGVTAVFEMPNTNPQTTTPEALADKVRRAHYRMHCDFAFWVGGTHENASDAPDLECLPAAAGIKVFMGSSTGSLLVEDDPGVAEILRRTRRRAAFHSEDEFRLRERAHLRRRGDPSSHPEWRGAGTALSCTRRVVDIAPAAGARPPPPRGGGGGGHPPPLPPAVSWTARGRRARPSTCSISRRQTKSPSWPAARMSRAARRRRIPPRWSRRTVTSASAPTPR